MKHLFIVNPVAGRQKPEDKLRLIHEAIDRLPAEKRESEEFEVYVTAAPMDACAYIKEAAKKAEELRNAQRVRERGGGAFKRRGDALPLRHGQRLHQDVRPG